MTWLIDFFSNKPRWLTLCLGWAMALLVGVVDYHTGVQISFSVFYTIPIAIVSWAGGLKNGIVLSLVCSVEWLLADLQDIYMHPLIPYWNAAVRLSVFILIAVILSKLRITLDLERKARAVAAQASRIKSEFLANMSHELRTPMNAIIAMSDLLAEPAPQPDHQKYVQVLKQEGGHLLRLLDDILDLSKVEAGQFDFVREPFDLVLLVDHITSFLAVRAQEKRLTLTYRIMPDAPTRLAGDAECLRRVLVNLIGNAIKFTERGEVRVDITRESSPGPSVLLRFSISDTGIGIPSEKLDAIFERFTTVDSSLTRSQGGTGLGLNISRKLVEGMGGRIWAESRVGKGSTLSFVLPFGVVAGPIEVKSEPVVDERTLSETMDGRETPIRILLVEDYKNNQIIVQTFLKRTRSVIDIAENGTEAVDKFKVGSYDLVLMDVQMPLKDGYTATSEMRQWERDRGIARTPILALTAHALKDEAERSLKAGCDAHLTKPIQKTALLKAVYDFTKGRKAAAAGPRGNGRNIVHVDPDLSQLVPQFLDDVRRDCVEAQQALHRNDFATVRTMGHRLKGSGGSYGFPEITHFGHVFETAATDGRVSDIQKALGDFRIYLDNLEVVTD